VFKNSRVDAQEIFTLAQLNAWTWARFKWHGMDKSYSDWHFYPTVRLADSGWEYLAKLEALVGRVGKLLGEGATSGLFVCECKYKTQDNTKTRPSNEKGYYVWRTINLGKEGMQGVLFFWNRNVQIVVRSIVSLAFTCVIVYFFCFVIGLKHSLSIPLIQFS